MLVYIDGPKFVKVYRVEAAAGSRRVPLGVILKSTHEFRVAAATSETDVERAEIDQVIVSYKNAWSAQIRSDVMRFPVIAREVADYYVTEASDLEKRLVSTAALELIRAIRKIEKAKQSQ